MGERSDQIEREISERRNELSENFSELEQRVKNAVDWRAQFEENPGTMLALAFGGGVVLSALLPSFGSRRRSESSYNDYVDYSEKSRGKGFYENSAPPPASAEATSDVSARNHARSNTRSSTGNNGKPSAAGDNFAALASALLSLAVTGVTGVIDNLLPGFQQEFMKAKTAKTSYG